MEYHFREIEQKWQKYWAENNSFKSDNFSDKPKFYALDMFPYPSGAGLHVGHPLGYIASDIVSRYKRHKGYNVLHPMGFDSFGLPAEQYAIQTGQHPAITTEENIARYKEQLNKLGFSFDWNREVRTSDPNYYKWTQWIFIQLFNSYYDNSIQKARPIDELIETFEQDGNVNVTACTSYSQKFGFDQWNSFSEKEKSEVLLEYRLTYLAEAEVNWCPDLGTVLANDEVINGVSERGGFPVIRKKMTQWMMRITAFADRLLQDLDTVDWPEPIKEAQKNWIGKSQGASIRFKTRDKRQETRFIEVFTTRPDTLLGVTFMTLAPEHPLVDEITTEEQKAKILKYKEETAKRSERERMADVKTISGEFTGAYAIHPFTNEQIPIWIGDYVLAGYGTGAVMAVPAGDERDFAFAKHFDIPIKNIFDKDISENAFVEKDNFVIENSDFLNGLSYKEATKKIISELENKNIGQGKTNFRLRDAVFSRQRYWGEPVPIYFENGIPKAIPTECLPLVLPEIEKYLPTETGEPPLGRAENWAWNTKEYKVVSIEKIDNKTVFPLELNTMPGWAGSSFYFNRYMDATNETEIWSKENINYWHEVDLYLGGSEHATGHLLYSRFWQKFLYDYELVPHKEYAKKLINQGMILGMSAFVYLYNGEFIHKEIGTTSNNTDKLFIGRKIYDFYIKNWNYINLLGANNNANLDIDENLKLKILEFIKILKSAVINLNKNYLNIDYQFPSINFPFEFRQVKVPIECIDESDNSLNIEKFLKFKKNEFEFKNGAIFIDFEEKIEVSREVEKMSKSKYNVVNPDDICEQYGADTLRMYEMFLGPIEQAKPWNTQGISGVNNFLRKFWRLFQNDELSTKNNEPTAEEWKILHQTIKKITEDIENFSFNTSISQFMIAVNEFQKLGTKSREILEPLCILISPFAPHIAEELWSQMGNKESITYAEFPVYNEKYLISSSKDYPISFNGKRRFNMELPLGISKEEVEKLVFADERTQKELQGRTPKNFVFVEGKIINLVG